MPDWNSFITAYKNASAEVRTIIDSGAIGTCLEEQVPLTSNQDSLLPQAIRILSHLTLQTINDEQARSLLQNLGLENVASNLGKISICIQSQSLSSINTDIAETEAALETLAPMRTMARDMHTLQGDHEPIHHSSQDQVLERREQPATAPPPPGPRWESQH